MSGVELYDVLGAQEAIYADGGLQLAWVDGALSWFRDWSPVPGKRYIVEARKVACRLLCFPNEYNLIEARFVQIFDEVGVPVERGPSRDEEPIPSAAPAATTRQGDRANEPGRAWDTDAQTQFDRERPRDPHMAGSQQRGEAATALADVQRDSLPSNERESTRHRRVGRPERARSSASSDAMRGGASSTSASGDAPARSGSVEPSAAAAATAYGIAALRPPDGVTSHAEHRPVDLDCTCTGPAAPHHEPGCPVRLRHPRTDLGDVDAELRHIARGLGIIDVPQGWLIVLRAAYRAGQLRDREARRDERTM